MNGDVKLFSTTQMTTDIAKLKEVEKEMLRLKSKIPADRMASFDAALHSNTIMLKTYEEALKQAGTKAKLFTKGSILMAAGLNKLKTVANFAASAMNKLFFIIGAIQLIGDIFGVDILKAIKDHFVDTSQAAADFKDGMLGAMTAAAGGVELLNSKLKELGANKDQIAGFATTYENVVATVNSSANSAITRNINRITLDMNDAAASANSLAYSAAINSNNLSTRDNAGNLAKEAGAKARQAFIPMLNAARAVSPVLMQIEAARARIADNVDSINVTKDLEVAANLKIENLALQTYITSLEKYGGVLDSFAGRIATLTGLSAIDVFAVLDSKKLQVINEQLELFGGLVARVGDNGVISFDSLTESQKKLVKAWFVGTSTMNKLSDAYYAGATTADKMSAAISGARSQLLDQIAAVKDNITANINNGMSIDQAVHVYDNYTASLRESIAANVVLRDKLAATENIFKNITKTFSKGINALNTLTYGGLINSTGNFAKSSKEILANQVSLLGSILDRTRESFRLQEAGAKLDANQVAEAEVYSTTLKAIVGRQVNSIKSLNDIVTKEKEHTRQLEQQLALQKQAHSLENLTNYYAKLETISANNLTHMQATNDLATSRLSTDQQRVDLIRQEAQASIDLAKNKKLDPSVVANRQSAIANEISSLTIGISNPSVRAAAEDYSNIVVSAMNSQNHDTIAAQKELIATDANSKKTFIDAQLAIFDAESKNIAARGLAEVVKKEHEIAIIRAKKALDIAKIRADEANNRIAASIVEEQIKGYTSFAKGVDGFSKSVKDLGNVLQSYIDADPRLKGNISKVTPTSISTQVATAGASATTALDASRTAQANSINAQITAINENAATKIANIQEQINGTITGSADTYRARVEKRARLELKLQEIQDSAANSTAALADTLGGSGGSGGSTGLSSAMKKVKSLFDNIEGAFNSALMGLNDLIFYGQGDFRSIMSNLFKTIQQDFFKSTIADPTAKFLTNSVGKLFGVKRGIDSVTLVNGAVPVTSAENTGPFNLFGKRAKGDKTLLESLIGKDSSIGKFFAKVFGKEGFFANLFKGIGGLFGGKSTGGGGILSFIGKFIGSLFGIGKKASGGVIQKFAGGGAVRDRIPLLAEPGEFMLRKPIAKALGAPALQELNATGNISSHGNVQVNVVNNGTPQEATASAPKFDGKKWIIDIVTKDIANNGPIKQSIRGAVV